MKILIVYLPLFIRVATCANCFEDIGWPLYFGNIDSSTYFSDVTYDSTNDWYYACGHSGSAIMDSKSYKVTLVKADADANILWQKQLSETSPLESTACAASSVDPMTPTVIPNIAVFSKSSRLIILDSD